MTKKAIKRLKDMLNWSDRLGSDEIFEIKEIIKIKYELDDADKQDLDKLKTTELAITLKTKYKNELNKMFDIKNDDAEKKPTQNESIQSKS